MKTIILPGYSVKNKEWADDVAKELNEKGMVTKVHYWDHWKGRGSLSVKKEINRILGEIGIDDINIIAKSVGVMVAMNLIPIIPVQVKKVILCGIAGVSGDERKKLLQSVLEVVSKEKILCIQNEKDPFVPYSDAKKFYHSVEPKLEVIEKSRSDHHYPFPDEFIKFLKAS